LIKYTKLLLLVRYFENAKFSGAINSLAVTNFEIFPFLSALTLLVGIREDLPHMACKIACITTALPKLPATVTDNGPVEPKPLIELWHHGLYDHINKFFYVPKVCKGLDLEDISQRFYDDLVTTTGTECYLCECICKQLVNSRSIAEHTI